MAVTLNVGAAKYRESATDPFSPVMLLAQNTQALTPIVKPYDATATWDEGDLCLYNNLVYKANQDISTAEVWTPGHWDLTTVGEEVKATNDDVSDLKNSLMKEELNTEIAYFHVFKVNGIVHLLAYENSSIPSSFVFPSGYRPEYAVDIPIHVVETSHWESGWLTINTDGTIIFHASLGGVLTGNVQSLINGMFPAG